MLEGDHFSLICWERKGEETPNNYDSVSSCFELFILLQNKKLEIKYLHLKLKTYLDPQNKMYIAQKKRIETHTVEHG